jgi:acyloxyacyl hydrolase
MARKKLSDHPAIVFYSLIGNDVCNSVTDTLAEMTSPEVFYNNTLDTLKYLETHLPPNSHVILIGLIDGGIIYDAMAHRIHPLGELVTFSQSSKIIYINT